MVIGNSYALNLVEAIEDTFQRNYSEFRYLSVTANFGLYHSNEVISIQGVEASKKQVELYKPDVLYIVARYLQNINDQIEADDKLVQEMNTNLAFYEQFAKKVYIMDAFPQYEDNFFTTFLTYLMVRTEDLEVLHLDKKYADKVIKNARKRLRMLTCKKCQLFDLSSIFVENEKYLAFDRNTLMSYIDDSVHLTAVGVSLCRLAFQNITNEVLKMF